MGEQPALAGGSVRVVNGVTVVTAPADLDVTSAGIMAGALEAADMAGVVVVDMSGNAFCDSQGIYVLASAAKRARAAGGEVRLVMGSPAVRRVFTLTGADRLFGVFTSVAGAVAGHSAPPGGV